MENDYRQWITVKSQNQLKTYDRTLYRWYLIGEHTKLNYDEWINPRIICDRLLITEIMIFDGTEQIFCIDLL